MGFLYLKRMLEQILAAMDVSLMSMVGKIILSHDVIEKHLKTKNKMISIDFQKGEGSVKFIEFLKEITGRIKGMLQP